MGKPGGSTPWLGLKIPRAGWDFRKWASAARLRERSINFQAQGAQSQATSGNCLGDQGAGLFTECFARFVRRRLGADVPAIFHECILRGYCNERVH